MIAQAPDHANHLSLAAEEAPSVRLLERSEAGERALPLAELDPLLAGQGQERLERGAELFGRAEAIIFVLLQAAIDDRAERAHVRVLLAHAGHGHIGVHDLGQPGDDERRKGVRSGAELIEDDAYGP